MWQPHSGAVQYKIILPTFNVTYTADVIINPDGTCGGGWICEHRWRQITSMVTFRNVVGSKGKDDVVNNWWTNGNGQMDFSRGERGFIVFNMENYDLNESLDTGMAAGTYCDIISGDVEDNGCIEDTVTVDSTGDAHIFISGQGSDSVIAFHAGMSSFVPLCLWLTAGCILSSDHAWLSCK